MVEYVKEEEGFIAYDRAPTGREAIRAFEDLQRLGESWNGNEVQLSLPR